MFKGVVFMWMKVYRIYKYCSFVRHVKTFTLRLLLPCLFRMCNYQPFLFLAVSPLFELDFYNPQEII
jgi:hypothetical protein